MGRNNYPIQGTFPKVIYGEFYDTTDQTPAVDTVTQITINTQEESQGITLSSNALTVSDAGTYAFNWRMQIEKSSGSVARDIHFWMRKNGSDVAYSAFEVNIKNNSENSPFGLNEIIALEAGDVITFYMHVPVSDGEGLGIYAHTHVGHPSIPSIHISVFRIN